MTEKIQELLAVLDMPSEEEQRDKLAYYVQPKPWTHIVRTQLSGWVVCTKCHKKIKAMPGSFTERQLLKYGRYAGSSEEWFYHLHTDNCSVPDPITESLADLAFRLRDEAVEIDSGVLFGRGLTKVCWKLFGENKYGLNEFLSWSATVAYPIHWIIAALIAKELSNDNP